MSRAFEAAKEKGRQARREGKPITACPYPDLRGGRYGEEVTFSRAFIRSWVEGWREEDARPAK